MKKRLLALSAFISLAGTTTFGQQEKLVTHFMYDKMTLNPGSTGIDQGICGTMIYRNQWDKVNGAPNSAIFNVEANMSQYIPLNLGLSVYHDAIGFARQNNALLNIMYPIQMGMAGTLGVGAGVGIINFGMDPDWVTPSTPVPNDPSLSASKTSGTNVDLNFGLYWRSRNTKAYAGISSTHLSQSIISAVFFSTARHYNIMGGYKMDMGSNGNKLDLQAMVRTDMVKFAADINARYIFMDNRFYGGLTYRTSDAVAVMLGVVPIPNFTVGYSYDLTINKLSSISRGTHELMVKYCYFIPPPPVHKSKHPRWL